MISFICLASVMPSLAFASEENDDGSFETFLSVLKTWGSFLARITGSYDSLENISIFSNLARRWHDLVTSDGFSTEKLFEALLKWLGISIMLPRQEQPQESYSI